MYGAIPSAAIAAVSGKVPKGPDRITWRRVKAKLEAAGVKVTER